MLEYVVPFVPAPCTCPSKFHPVWGEVQMSDWSPDLEEVVPLHTQHPVHAMIELTRV